MSLKINERVSDVARKDILDLERRINDFKEGKTPEDKFKHFRLTRGVYGQRQVGVQMIRIKLPYGRVTTDQLVKMAEVSDKYATGNLHLTTRQDIQLHYVKLEDSPALWAELEEAQVTLREACGNTVRNVTGSSTAGIDPDEPFDITPYAHEFTHYFLRNPICQDMGRKFKASFSSSDMDSAFSFMHDIGFIPRVKTENGEEVRGFKVIVGGGLGAQAILGHVAYEFLPVDEFIPFTEAILRVFDRHGERTKRFKARMKFLVQKLGLEEFMKLVDEQRIALKNKKFNVDTNVVPEAGPAPQKELAPFTPENEAWYNDWVKTNTFEQKQKGFYGVYLRVLTGDISSDTARALAKVVKEYAADDIRVTVNQGLLLRHVRPEALPYLYAELDKLDLAAPGFDSTHDITACPGSDTCNLAVTNSTALTRALEAVLKDEYYDLINETNIKIKISGCMNACGQHMIANLGFHGSSIKNGDLVAPAMQVVLGGGVEPDGSGSIADKVVKIPSKKIPDVLRYVLNDYEEKAEAGEYFNAYYRRLGKNHFYQLLKPLADLDQLSLEDYQDWGKTESFTPEIGVGECAGITLDVVGTVINEAVEKIELAEEGFSEGAFADAIYNAYSGFVIGAKALLLSEDVQCNTQSNIISDFDEHFINEGKLKLDRSFDTLVYQINENEPGEEFAKSYIASAGQFLVMVKGYRQEQINKDKSQADKQVIDNYYKA